MKIHDSLNGALLLVFAAAVYWHTLGFPEIQGDPVGPALFPRLIAIGMALCGIVLIVRGLLARDPRVWIEIPEWIRMPGLVAAFLLVVLGLLVSYFFLDKLGFLVIAPLLLGALMLVLRVRVALAIPVAIGASLLIHAIFYKGLGVPLPWGLLEAWHGSRHMDSIAQAFALIFDPYVLMVIGASAIYGLFVGAIPGLTATMATALLVPITFFMPAIPAVAAIVTATAMAIFSGDIPGALLRIPGTPASAAYCDEAYAMTRKGQAELVLGAGLVFSVIGGIFGTVVLVTAAPMLADFALRFSTFEYFWLVLLGLTCAVFIASDNVVKGLAALFIGLLVSSVGMENPAAHPRFTFDAPDLMGGITLIPMMVGLFAVSEVLRYVTSVEKPLDLAQDKFGSIFKGQWALVKKYPVQALRGSGLGTLIGALPGAGADIAAWMSYAVSKKFSKEPEKFGTGHVEGVVESGAANNSALSGAWIPALVFGIPGDSITAIAIGVLYMKNMFPGPQIFLENPQNIYAVFIVFFLANLLMLPLGVLAIKSYKQVLRVSRAVLMPAILVFCMVGAFAINNTQFDIGIMLAFGVLAFFMEKNGFPVAPVILGAVLGGMLERHFTNSIIKADGDWTTFFSRPIAGTLGVMTVLVWLLPVAIALWKRSRRVTQ